MMTTTSILYSWATSKYTSRNVITKRAPFGTSELKIRPRNYALKILSRRYITTVVSSAQSTQNYFSSTPYSTMRVELMINP
jgi:hypothetical protein